MKYFIVSSSLEKYEDYVDRKGIGAKDVFYCESRRKAIMDAYWNWKQDIEVKIIEI